MGQGYDLLGKLRHTSRDGVQRLIDNADLLEILTRVDPASVNRVQFEQFIAGKLPVSVTPLFQDRYTPPEIQVMNLRAWNTYLGFYSPEQIQELFASIPPFDWSRPRVALTLCWSMNTPRQTIMAKLQLAPRVYG